MQFPLVPLICGVADVLTNVCSPFLCPRALSSLGNLRYIRSLKPWPLKRVMVEKYGWNEADTMALCDFLLPMLHIDHRSRAHARDMVDHPWLEVDADELDRIEW